MKIQLNNNEIIVPDKSTIAELLHKYLNITQEKKGIAIAVNESVIPKDKWAEYEIKENDNILVITAAQGG